MNINDIRNDWRFMGQDEYLLGVKLVRRKYDGDGHAHCEFCWHKFMKNAEGVEDCSSEGYVTENGEYWICDNCYKDFFEPFEWAMDKKVTSPAAHI